MPTIRPLLKKDQPQAQSFDFSADVRQLLRALADGMGVSQVAVLELSLRHLARRVAAGGAIGSVPATRDAAGRTGSPHSFRLSADGRQLLRELAAHEPPLAASQVAVVELVIRRFAALAEREGLVGTLPRQGESEEARQV